MRYTNSPAKLRTFSDICKKNRQILVKWRFFYRFSGETARNAVSTGSLRIRQSRVRLRDRKGQNRSANLTGDRCFRSKEFYVLGVGDSEHSRAALTPQNVHWTF